MLTWYTEPKQEMKADELHLKGRIQVETALGALVYTGINPDAQTRLQTFLDVHAQLSDGKSQDDLSIYTQGETAEQEKVDIITALDKLKNDESVTPAMKIAAVALREIL